MKNTMKRILAMLLLVTVITSNGLASTAYAMENTESVMTDESRGTEKNVTADEKQGTENAVADGEEPNEDQTFTGLENQNTEIKNNEDIQVVEEVTDTTESVNSENRLSYVYIEKPYIETPETQNVLVSWGDGTEAINNMRITVRKEDGSTEEWPCSNNVGQLYLFSKDYPVGSEASTYQVVDVKFEENGTEQQFQLIDSNVKAEFGVDKKYDGIDELRPLDPEQMVEDNLETSIVTIDENGEIEAQDNIAEALSVAEEETGVSKTSRKLARTAERTSDIVVALDPGHDSRHAGAAQNGLNEEILTLKIANYAKAELEKYSGVKVYMTRTGADCPYPSTGSSGACIKQRANAAAAAGAKIFVSLHINSSTVSSPNGSEILIPNTSWRPQVAADANALAEKILAELKAVGLNERPKSIYSKDTSVGERYPDGSLSDYFAVHIYNKQNNIPGIIIEHAFISNTNDVNNFLNTDAGLKKLGVADATGIAKYLGLQKTGERVSIPEGTYVLESALQTGKVAGITENSVENFAGLTLNDNNNLSSQRFEITSVGNGYYTIAAEHSGKAIGVKNGSSTPGTPLVQNDANNSTAQKWGFISAGDGYYYICSGLGTYMDVFSAGTSNGTMIDGYTFNKTTAQKWKLIKSNYRPVADGTYSISNKINDNQQMDVMWASMNDGANIQLYSKNNSSAQRYEVNYVGDGYYKILAEHSGKALDVENGSVNSGANLQQYSWTGGKNQLWKFVDAGNGYYYLKSKCGTVIDPESKNVESGCNLNMKKVSYADSQKWKLSKEEYRPVKDGVYVIGSGAAEFQSMTEKNGNIQLETYNNSSKQKFKITYVGNGYYTIILSETGKALDVVGASDKPGANVQTYIPNETNAQLWKFVPVGNGNYYIKSKVGTTLDLPGGNISSGTNIQTYSMNGTLAQQWTLDSGKANMSDRPIEDGTYMIQNATALSQVLDVNCASENDGANIQTYSSNKSSAQRFEVVYVGDGYYKIISECSGKVLDIKYASVSAGANVQQYGWNNTSAQLWQFISAGNGNYYIKSKLGTVLDINKGTASSGSNVQMDTFKGESSQKWKLTKDIYRPIEDGTYSLRVTAASNMALDIQEKAVESNANVCLYTYDFSESQRFNITYVKDGYYKIVSSNSGKAIECNGSNVRQADWIGNDSQLWKFIIAPGGGYYIKNKSGLVMDIYCGVIADKSNVQVFEQNGSSAQKWNVKKEKDYKIADVKEGVYTIRTALNKNYVLDVAWGSLVNGGNIQLYTSNDSDAQKFEVKKVSDGYYKIISLSSGKALDICAGSVKSGTNVQQYTWNNSNAQLWRFIEADNGKYFIQSKLGTVLDVFSAICVNSSNVQSYELNESVAQQWVLDGNETGLYAIMGQSNISVDQMVKYYDANAVAYPYDKNKDPKTDAPTIKEFCTIYKQEAEIEGVKAEVAFCQAMLETGFLRFGGDVKKEQYNFAGLGATGGGVPGNSFSSIRIGIRAHIQHLKAYATTEPLKQECVDERYKFVNKGCAPYVQWLGIQENPQNTGWAASANYGYNIVDLYIKKLKNY